MTFHNVIRVFHDVLLVVHDVLYLIHVVSHCFSESHNNRHWCLHYIGAERIVDDATGIII